MGGVHPIPFGRTGGCRFLHCGGADLARLATYYVLFFMEIRSRRVSLGGITRHSDSAWMQQVARKPRWSRPGT